MERMGFQIDVHLMGLLEQVRHFFHFISFAQIGRNHGNINIAIPVWMAAGIRTKKYHFLDTYLLGKDIDESLNDQFYIFSSSHLMSLSVLLTNSAAFLRSQSSDKRLLYDP